MSTSTIATTSISGPHASGRRCWASSSAKSTSIDTSSAACPGAICQGLTTPPERSKGSHSCRERSTTSTQGHVDRGLRRAKPPGQRRLAARGLPRLRSRRLVQPRAGLPRPRGQERRLKPYFAAAIPSSPVPAETSATPDPSAPPPNLAQRAWYVWRTDGTRTFLGRSLSLLKRKVRG